ncbi:hypothetical protein ONZ45_g19613 [Pleurotus djamor]|nr:hypothetical protein ONZ45_g19613 [Pleurotus djamor]
MQTAIFVNANTNYFSAPQQLNRQGFIVGNAVVVIEEISSFKDARVSDARTFVYFRGLPEAPVNGALRTTVTGGLPSGIYRLSTELRAANHQPILVSSARHGSLGDTIYFTIGNVSESELPVENIPILNNLVPAGSNTQAASQSSLTLDPGVIAAGFSRTGQDVGISGQTSSLTSQNNYINYCLTSSRPLMNGTPMEGGSCNPVPMGILPAAELTPSSKFANPRNGDNIPAGQTFNISLSIRNFQAGALANLDRSFLAAPQQVNSQGLVLGYAKVVIEALDGFNQTNATDPTKFAFFQHMNGLLREEGMLTTDVTGGLPDGYYRLSSMLSASNSQPVLSTISQHGAINDAVYFTVGDPTKGQGSSGNNETATGAPPTPTGNPSSSGQSQSVDKAAIIGGVLGGVLGAIVIAALVFLILRYRRQKRFLSDTEASRLPFASPFEEAVTNPYYRREKPLPTDPSGSTTAFLGSSSQIAGPSSGAFATSRITDTNGIEESSPPPYQK